MSDSPQIPNILWSYWESPSNRLPPIVETCRNSWAKAGKFAEIHALGPEDVFRFLRSKDLPRRFHELPPVRKADAVRLALLARYGGFWADAGILVTAPVKSWVQPQVSDSGFFVFQDVDQSRIMDNWFIGSHHSSAFLQELYRRHNDFFNQKRIHEAHSLAKTPSKLATHSIVAIKKILGPSVQSTAAWAKFPLSRLPMYPYFVMHYMANAMVGDPDLAEDFASMTKVTAAQALALRKLVDRQKLSFDRAKMPSEAVPVHKLNTYRKYYQAELEVLHQLVTP